MSVAAFWSGWAPSEKLALVGALIAATGVLVALVNVTMAMRHERRRLQPIVIAHEVRGLYARDAGGFGVRAAITSEGEGSAFNVRFGVSYLRRSYAYVRVGDNLATTQRVLRSGVRLPPQGGVEILIPSDDVAQDVIDKIKPHERGTGKLYRSCVYWAWYEDASGKTWETRNPGDHASRVEIRRVWWWRRLAMWSGLRS